MRKTKLVSMLAAAAGILSCFNQTGTSTSRESTATIPAGALSSGNDPSLPPDAEHVAGRLLSSPRHGEWAMVRTPQGDSVKVWVVYPERRDRAAVVIVVHEIYGLSTWARGVADQLAAAGFIAIAPDLLTMSAAPRTADTVSTQDATAAIRTLKAVRRYGIVGFCWGGGVSFAHAAHAPNLGASVVYYGVSPSRTQLGTVRAPVLGLYAGNDARVDATIPLADSVLLPLGRTYVHKVYDGAGHGFLRQQSGMEGANLTATRQAWPATVAWFRKYLRS